MQEMNSAEETFIIKRNITYNMMDRSYYFTVKRRQVIARKKILKQRQHQPNAITITMSSLGRNMQVVLTRWSAVCSIWFELQVLAAIVKVWSPIKFNIQL